MAPDGPLQEQPTTRLFLSPPPESLPPPTSRSTDRWLSFLSDAEQDYLKRQRGKRHHEYLLSRALLRHALSLTLSPQKPPSDWQLRPGRQGPPTIESQEARDWHCSLSHSAGRVTVALSNDGPCGVDIERHRSRRNRPELANSFFTAGERALLDQTPEAARETVFYRLWTLKEAWYKAGNHGSFSDILSGLDFSTPVTDHTGTGERQAWWQEIDGYSLAFAGPHKPVSLTQLLPGGEEMAVTNRLRGFIAIAESAE